MFIEEAAQAAVAEEQEGPGDGIKEALSGLIPDGAMDAVIDLVKKHGEKVARNVVQKQSSRFWGEWYPAHRTDVIVNLPLRDIKVNDFRKVFELIFGPRPAT